MADDPAVNRPASGSYGERKVVDDLKRSLPAEGGGPATAPPTQPSGPIPAQPRPIGRPPTPVGPPGVPAPVLAPTGGVEPGGLQPAPNPAAMLASASDQDRLLLFLDIVANSPGVSQASREWAENALAILIGGDEL